MAGWTDILVLIVVVAILSGVTYGVIVASQQVSTSVENTKAKLKDRGFDVSRGGVSVKTSGRIDRDDYIDATQRGFIKAMGAASFRKDAHPSPSAHGASGSVSGASGSVSGAGSSMERRDSGASLNSEEKKKRKSLFGRK
ncbi:uncharacterized protein SCHCODRAFT_01202170 [Schizophyllum commune H4-8]|nr:uncharacterized protein SCHCODRAFT_01202170 [Schizophyllum commune H4-8]KAI5891796.1 hypothetical protein SCHCODRAFT_01202170 [Schizophyllum commune H4-8]